MLSKVTLNYEEYFHALLDKMSMTFGATRDLCLYAWTRARRFKINSRYFVNDRKGPIIFYLVVLLPIACLEGAVYVQTRSTTRCRKCSSWTSTRAVGRTAVPTV